MDPSSPSHKPEDRLSRVEASAEANAVAISQLREEATDCRSGVSDLFSDLRAGFSDLRAGQALLAQFLVEQRELNAEFHHSTNAARDRIDQTLAEYRKILDSVAARQHQSRQSSVSWNNTTVGLSANLLFPDIPSLQPVLAKTNASVNSSV